MFTNMSPEEKTDRVNFCLDKVQLTNRNKLYPGELSGGMKKRISLARTIIVNPVIMLYDEPTTGLDPVTSREISVLINDIQKKFKTASIIITHDMDCVRNVADRIIMLHEGLVYKEGSLKEFESDKDALIHSFFNN